MTRRFLFLLGAASFAVALAMPGPAEAQIFSKRGTAILPPAECPDGPNCYDKKGTFTPCYSPATPISCRWRTTKEVPYYPGYCKHFRGGACTGDPDVSGCGVVAGDGYGIYSGASRDEATLLRLGANGPYMPATADILDGIEGPRGCPR